MHVIRTVLLMLVAVMALACKSPTPNESVDFDTSVDFNGPKKFAFLEDSAPRVEATEARTLTRQAIERELLAAGHRFVPAKQSDFLIAYRVGAYAKVRVSGTISGEGGQQGILMIALRDSKTEQTVWYGRGDKTVGQATNVKREVDRITHSLLSRFPPPPGSVPDDLN